MVATYTLRRHSPGVEDTPENRAAIGERIARARAAAGLTNASAFARDIGVVPNTVYRWEKGELAPDIWSLESIASACRVTTDWLLRGVGAGDVADVLLAWKHTPRGASASAEALTFIESVALPGYVPSPTFYDLLLFAFEQGLRGDEAVRAAKTTTTARGA